MYERTILDSGLRVVTGELPHTHSASVSIFVGAGSRYEGDERAGVSHFLEHMLFKGTDRRRTPREIAEAIEGVGGYFNAEAGVARYWVANMSPKEWRVHCTSSTIFSFSFC